MLNLDVNVNFATRRPLVPMEAAAYLLQVDHKRATELIELGRLAWAWDFAVPGARRRELRVWRGSVAAWLRSGGLEGGECEPAEAVLADVLPQRDLYTSELRRFWILDKSTLRNLMQCGALEVISVQPRNGALNGNGASRISRGSALRFLRQRQVGAEVAS